VTSAVIAGGFDPVPVPARVGDTLEGAIHIRGGAPSVTFSYAVPGRLRPVVVRTDPSSGKRDVPLNTTIIVVFSEPIDGTTLTTSSVQLWGGTTPVAGTVSALPGSATGCLFVPSAPLDPNTEYRLVVTRAVRDLDGESLDTEVTVMFKTGQLSTGAVASVMAIPESVTITVQSSVAMSAMARDANGNALSGRAITWTSNNQSVAIVDSAGVVFGVAVGSAFVTATSEGLSDTAAIAVTVATPPAAPSEIVTNPAGSSAIAIYWRDNSSNESGFRIERFTDDSPTWGRVGTTTSANGYGSLVDGTRTAERQACYRVVAFNGPGDSPPSDIVCTAPPAAPTNLRVDLVDELTMDVSWSDNSAVEGGYQVLIVGETGGADVVSLPSNSTSYRWGSSSGWNGWRGWCGVKVVATKGGGHSDETSVVIPYAENPCM